MFKGGQEMGQEGDQEGVRRKSGEVRMRSRRIRRGLGGAQGGPPATFVDRK